MRNFSTSSGASSYRPIVRIYNNDEEQEYVVFPHNYYMRQDEDDVRLVLDLDDSNRKFDIVAPLDDILAKFEEAEEKDSYVDLRSLTLPEEEREAFEKKIKYAAPAQGLSQIFQRRVRLFDNDNNNKENIITFNSGSIEERDYGLYLYLVMGGGYHCWYCINAETPDEITPSGDYSLLDKIMMRFEAAAKNDTNIDLRFCTGEEEKRNPAHDNLHKGYNKKVDFKL